MVTPDHTGRSADVQVPGRSPRMPARCERPVRVRCGVRVPFGASSWRVPVSTGVA